MTIPAQCMLPRELTAENGAFPFHRRHAGRGHAHRRSTAMIEDWAKCSTRRPYVLNSLKHQRDDLKDAARRCRKAYTKPFMSDPSNWLADAYDEAAAVLERYIAQFPPHKLDGAEQ